MLAYGATPVVPPAAARTRRLRLATGLLTLLAACDRPARPGASTEKPLFTVYTAGAIAPPMRALLDSFARRQRVRTAQESAGSVETARKITELGKLPDVVVLADREIFPRLLMPRYVKSYLELARDRMVLAYTPTSRFASEIDSANWMDVVRRPGLQVGRSNPALDPAGYRALLVWSLAERFYGRPGLADSLLVRAEARNVRPKSADLVALLQAGVLDYAWGYESVAQAARLSYVRLPRAINLSEPADSAFYACATARVAGGRRGDSVTIRGAPIMFAIARTIGAPNPVLAEQFITFVTSATGRTVLRAAGFDPVSASPAPVRTTGTDAAPPTVMTATRSDRREPDDTGAERATGPDASAPIAGDARTEPDARNAEPSPTNAPPDAVVRRVRKIDCGASRNLKQ